MSEPEGSHQDLVTVRIAGYPARMTISRKLRVRSRHLIVADASCAGGLVEFCGTYLSPHRLGIAPQRDRREMPTTILPDNGHAASQRIGLQKLMRLGSELDEETPTGPALFDRRGLHQQIHDALETPAFKIAAAGKSGEALKEAVAAAMAVEKVPVEIISVAPSENAEAYAATPYEAVWETRPGSVRERSYFGV